MEATHHGGEQASLMPRPEKKRRGSAPARAFTRDDIRRKLQHVAEHSTGMAQVQALNALKKFIDEEQPDTDTDIRIAWVPLRYVNREFIACIQEAQEVA